MHITKNSLSRKLSIISLAVLVFVSSLLGANANTANAIGADTVVKLVGGKAVVRAVAEKAGLALSKKQLDNVTGYIQKKSYDGDTRAIDFSNTANAVTSGTFQEASKPGFKKYVIDPLAWISGLDLVFEAIGIFTAAMNSGEQVDLQNQCGPVVLDGYSYNNWALIDSSNHLPAYITWTGTAKLIFNPATVANRLIPADGDYSKIGTWKYFQYNATTQVYEFKTSGSNTQPSAWVYSLTSASYSDSCQAYLTPTAQDIPSTTNVSPTVINNFDNDTYNTNTTYNLEIELPDIVNYDDTTPWNEKDPNIEQEVDPVVPEPPVDSDGDGIPDTEDDSDGDGTTDDKDSDADKGGWLENILPIITLIAIFDLLKAVLFYLARMFEFILTIPLIEAKPIDNVAFEWFRTAEIVGIEIYSIISLLATIGLSFAVYKVVRRLLP